MSLPYDYKPATINQIDLDPGNGPYGNAQRVVLERGGRDQGRQVRELSEPAVSLSDLGAGPDVHHAPAAWWSKPSARWPQPAAPAAKTVRRQRRAARCSTRFLKATILRVRGKLVFEVDSVAPMTVVEHQLFVESIDILSPDATINPIVFSDTALYSQFIYAPWTDLEQVRGHVGDAPANDGHAAGDGVRRQRLQDQPGRQHLGRYLDGDYCPAGATTFPTIG